MDAGEYTLMDAAERHMWWYRALHARLLAALLPVTGRVLDAGCGTGGLLEHMRSTRPDVWAAGAELMATAAKRAAEKSGGAVVCARLPFLPFADQSFDAAVAADVLCHEAVEPAAALAEFARVLRPGGRLVINMPAFAWLASAHDRKVRNDWRTTRTELRKILLQGGFKPLALTYWNSLLLPLMILRRKTARQEAASDVAAYPPWLDASLFAVTEFERRLPFSLPAGGSVLAVAFRAGSEH